MSVYASKSHQAFFDDALFGTRKISVPDPDWTRPTVQVNGVELEDPDAECPFVEIDNPNCRLPEDAVEISRDVRDALLASQATGMVIDWSGDFPAAVQAPAPSIEKVRANLRAWADSHLDGFAKSWEYTQGIDLAVTWLSSDNPQFKAEAGALAKYRDDVWSMVGQLGHDIEAGATAPQDETAFKALLPLAPLRP